MNQVTLLILLISSVVSMAQSADDFFLTDYNAALSLAQASDKPIFLDGYAEWCAPCKHLDKVVFSQSEVQDYLLSNFVPLKLDLDKPGNQAIRNKYQVDVFPTLLFLDPNGHLIHRKCGAPASNSYDWFIALCQEALDDNRNLSSTIDAFQASAKSTEDIIDYLGALDQHCTQDYKVGKQLLEVITIDHLYNPKTIEALHASPLTPDHHLFDSMMIHLVDFTEFHEDKIVFRLIERKATDQLKVWLEEGSYDEFLSFRSKWDSLVPYPSTTMRNLDYSYLKSTHQWANYATILDSLIQTSSYAPHQVNNWAWELYENTDNEALLKMAAKWMEDVVNKLPDDYYALDTYAAILLQLGEKEKGLLVANNAIESAKKSGIDYSSTNELIDQYK